MAFCIKLALLRKDLISMLNTLQLLAANISEKELLVCVTGAVSMRYTRPSGAGATHVRAGRETCSPRRGLGSWKALWENGKWWQ